jgi:hypothetical protein
MRGEGGAPIFLHFEELVREREQVGGYQVFCEPVDCFGEFVADGAAAGAEENGGFCLGVLLEDDAADDLAVDQAEAVEAAFDVEDEDECVFEGADSTAGDPAAPDGFAEQVGGAAYLYRGVEIAAQEVFGVLAIEGPADERFVVVIRDWFGLGFGELMPLNLVDGRGQEGGLGCCAGAQLGEGKLQGGAQKAPPVKPETATAKTVGRMVFLGRPRRLRLSGEGKSLKR